MTTAEERFENTVDLEDQEDVLTRIVEAAYDEVPPGGEFGLCIYSRDTVGFDQKIVCGSIEIGDRAFEFEIEDGPSNGTVIREWVEL